ncbi:cell wall-active antibiotics response protein [Solitalea sp. MAHUQ-68]|uniref:Cell wall-active antibiotics response protein n=1 Tax=Solitalea agri TaxID=2953739 RepID=A0A9X2JD56_9SPHI|nr:LiaF domain-containing protein [Solitalea agri]MCO4293768.1 cell wall-active antibiotics response protein [Solitalea agri]
MDTQEFKNMDPRFSRDRFSERRRQHIERHGRPNNILGGLVIIIIGVIYLLRQMDLGIPEYLFSWQGLLIGIGVFVGAKHNFRGIGWLVPILIGSYFMANEYFLWDSALRKYIIPAGIIFIGLVIMTRPKHRRPFECATEDVSDEDVLNITNAFGGTKRTVLSKNFKGGRIQSVFGGADINLSQADFEGVVTIEIDNVFGGTKMIIPANWEVKIETTSIFGGVDDKRPIMAGGDTPTKKLILKGSNIFGGIDIKSY